MENEQVLFSDRVKYGGYQRNLMTSDVKFPILEFGEMHFFATRCPESHRENACIIPGRTRSFFASRRGLGVSHSPLIRNTTRIMVIFRVRPKLVTSRAGQMDDILE